MYSRMPYVNPLATHVTSISYIPLERLWFTESIFACCQPGKLVLAKREVF